MKSATIPALSVEPALREAAESVLADNETLSSFVEESLSANIRKRNISKPLLHVALPRVMKQNAQVNITQQKVYWLS